MTRDVLVTISGLQVMQQESGVEPVDLITAGDYYKKNDKHYVIFDEVMEGFEGVTKYARIVWILRKKDLPMYIWSLRRISRI